MAIAEKNIVITSKDELNQTVIYKPYTSVDLVEGAVSSINGITPDDNGNVNISRIDNANNAKSADSVEWNNVKNKPTNVSAFINDAGYLTQHQSLDGYAKKSDVAALMSTKLGVTATAYAATRDGAGNNISTTYAKKTDISGMVKSVNGVTPNVAGDVTIAVGGGVSTDTTNTWTLKQTFSDIDVEFEYYKTEFQGSSSATPTESVLFCQTLGNFTLNLSNIVSKIPNGRSTVFSAYLSCFSDGVLTITNAGTLYYVGNASDLALTGTGLLVNILIIKNTSGAVDSIVQSSKLS